MIKSVGGPLFSHGVLGNVPNHKFAILRLLLIFSLSSIGSSIKVEIDFNRCKEDTVCFIRQSCLVDKTAKAAKIEAAKGLLVSYRDEPLNDNTCDVILQARSFTLEKFHIMVQVNNTSSGVPVTDVTLQQNGVQFRCSNGVATTENADFEISPFGERLTVQPNILSCSFTLQSSQYIAGRFTNNLKKVEIVISGQTKTIEGGRKNAFWNVISAARTCNPEIITTKNKGNGTHAFGKVDNTASLITCPSLENLVVVRADGREEYSDKIICDESKMWSFDRKIGDQIDTVVVDFINDAQEIIQVYCIIKVCSLCQRLEDVECAGCTPVNYTNDIGQCATSTCENGLWRFSEGEGYPMEGEMKCDHKMGSQNQRESVWYFTPKGKSNPVEISKATCAMDAVCLHPNPDDSMTITRLECPWRDDRSLICNPLQPEGDRSKKDLYCKNGYQLRYEYDGKITDATNLTCSAITGKYYDDSNNIVPEGSQIYCESYVTARTTTTASAPIESAFLSTVAVVGIVIGVIVVLVVAGCALFYWYIKIRLRYQIRKNEELQRKFEKEEEEAAESRAQAELEKGMSFDERMTYEASKKKKVKGR